MVLAIALAGCERSVPARETAGAAASQTSELVPSAPAKPAIPPAPAAQDRSPAAARALVERYYALIGARDFAAAYRLWGENGAPGQDEAAFAASFGDVALYRAEVLHTGRPEGGCGSIYLELRVRVTGKRAGGAPIRLEGPVILRHVNDVDGSSPAQRAWRIASTALKPAP